MVTRLKTLVHYTDSSGFGGAEQIILTLMAGLDKTDWRAILLHHGGRGITPLLDGARASSIEVCEVPRLDGKHLLRGAQSFRRKLCALRPDIFHAHLTWPFACTWGLLQSAWSGVPVRVATLQLYVELPRSLILGLKGRLVRSVVHRYIGVSQEVANRLVMMGVPREKIEVVFNAIDVARFAGGDIAPHGLRMKNGQKIVFTSARLTEQKGLAFLIQAAAQVPEAQFVIAGDGPDRPLLEKQASELGVSDRVSFLGYRQDIPKLLTQCDVFVLPSLFEGLPVCVLEAMAAGKPVVASAIGGTMEAITDRQNGLLVPPGNASKLASAIQMILSDTVLAESLAAAGKERVVNEFSAERMILSYSRIYRNLLRRKRNDDEG